jgi:hypothetical protein
MLGGPPHPWHDEALTVGQRICAALAAGLELGERLTDLAWRTEAGQRERLAWQAGYEHACQDARLDVMRRRGAAWQAGYAHGFAEGYTAARDDATHRDTPDHTHDGYRCVGGAR